VEFFDHSRYVSRVVLQVGINGDDYLAAGVGKPGAEGGSLAEVPLRFQ